MDSHINGEFRRLFRRLPAEVRRVARAAYKQWVADPAYPALHFKELGSMPNHYSIRIGLEWRALGIKEGDSITWYWIGRHTVYDRKIR